MKAVFVGGGSFRILPIVRALFDEPEIFADGEIHVVDRRLERAEAVGRMLQRTPEYANTNCRIHWGADLDRALEGADVLYITMAIGNAELTIPAAQASHREGFLSSDQMSITGAFLSLVGGPIMLDFARRMERCCPDAQMWIFANPVAVYSGLVNNYTKISALGVCGGFGNHRWDLTRLLTGKDEYRDEYEVRAAGINHLSFIQDGTWNGRDLYDAIDQRLAKGLVLPRPKHPRPAMRKHIRHGVKILAEMYQRFGKIIFSTEGDGMHHLFYEEMWKRGEKERAYLKGRRAKAAARRGQEARRKREAEFDSYLDAELPGDFWDPSGKHAGHFGKAPYDIALPLFRSLAGLSTERIVASRTNHGAVDGFPDRTVLEYSMEANGKQITPVPGLAVPLCFHGLISSLATHQTLLADAIATRDPQVLANALFAYPVKQNTRSAKRVFQDHLRIFKDSIAPNFQETGDYL